MLAAPGEPRRAPAHQPAAAEEPGSVDLVDEGRRLGGRAQGSRGSTSSPEGDRRARSRSRGCRETAGWPAFHERGEGAASGSGAASLPTSWSTSTSPARPSGRGRGHRHPPPGRRLHAASRPRASPRKTTAPARPMSASDSTQIHRRACCAAGRRAAGATGRRRPPPAAAGGTTAADSGTAAEATEQSLGKSRDASTKQSGKAGEAADDPLQAQQAAGGRHKSAALSQRLNAQSARTVSYSPRAVGDTAAIACESSTVTGSIATISSGTSRQCRDLFEHATIEPRPLQLTVGQAGLDPARELLARTVGRGRPRFATPLPGPPRTPPARRPAAQAPARAARARSSRPVRRPGT
jgi:hypothetical protein